MIVGLYSSVPQSGKSTIKNIFVERGFKALSLAEPVKQNLLIFLQSLCVEQPERYLYSDWKTKVIPELGCTGGYFMSTYATDFMRDMINPDIWLNILLRKINHDNHYIVDDMRFPNEYDAFDCRILIINNTAEQNHGRSNKSEGLLDNHKFDYRIVNNPYLGIPHLSNLTNQIIDDILINKARILPAS